MAPWTWPGRDAASGHPHGETERVVLAPVGPFGGRSAPEFSAPEDQGIVEQPASFQVVQEGGDRAVNRGAALGEVLAEAAVMVPGVVRRGVEELDVAHAPFREPAGQETLPAEQVGRRIADPVEAFRHRALARDVEGFRGVALHAEGQFKRCDAGVELTVDHAVTLVELVEPPDRVELGAL